LGIILVPKPGTLYRAHRSPDGSGFWAKTRTHGYPKRAVIQYKRDARRWSEAGSPAPSAYFSQ
jgi:hypothetical protein